MNLIKNRLTHLREVYDLAYLLSIHIIEVMPLELRLLLNLASNVIKVHHLSELPQGCHGAPQTLLDHLAHVQHHLAEMRPAPLQADLKESPHDTARTLGHVDHVGVEVIALHLEARDVSLKQYVDFCSWLV